MKTEDKRSGFYYNFGPAYDNVAGQDVFCAKHLTDLAAARSFKFSKLATMVALIVRL